jgi:hypothetical protein
MRLLHYDLLGCERRVDGYREVASSLHPLMTRTGHARTSTVIELGPMFRDEGSRRRRPLPPADARRRPFENLANAVWVGSLRHPNRQLGTVLTIGKSQVGEPVGDD